MRRITIEVAFPPPRGGCPQLAQGHTTTYLYDSRNRVQQVTDPKGGVTRFGYDVLGRLRTVTDPRGLTTTYAYNGFGELTSQHSPDTGTTAFDYDAAGRRSWMRRNDSSTTTYTHDLLGRVTAVQAGGQTLGYSYDGCSYGKGRLCGSSDPSGGWTQYAYDAFGQLLSRRGYIMR